MRAAAHTFGNLIFADALRSDMMPDRSFLFSLDIGSLDAPDWLPAGGCRVEVVTETLAFPAQMIVGREC